jgi:hypothetical protein
MAEPLRRHFPTREEAIQHLRDRGFVLDLRRGWEKEGLAGARWSALVEFINNHPDGEWHIATWRSDE